MARTLKDVICRYKTQSGYLVHRKAGWDTHGLPVELGVEKKLGIRKEDVGVNISIEDYNRTCRESVMEFTGKWEELTRQMGYWVNMDDPYITYDNKYIETLWWMLSELYKKGLLYKGFTIQLKVRDGLMCGICNGFQALIKLGLVPYGEIIDTDESCPTLTFNSIGRHQSRLVRTRIASNKSPWLANTKAGDVYTVAISHGEGRFLASDELIAQLAANGQIATQYVDLDGKPTSDILFNPNNSCAAIEGITSPDGHVIGKMGHSERIGNGLYKNVYGEYDMKMFESAVEYFK